MVNTRSGAGGKVVRNRRRQRIAATPYDRPPPSLLPKSPSWFSGVVVPSARAIASGAGKIISAIFSESSSSSSEDEDHASEDDIVNDNFPKIPCNHESTLIEKTGTSSELTQHRQEPLMNMWMSETKKMIEQLIIRQTFSSEECDRLIKVLNSRVIDSSIEAGDKSSTVGSPGNKLNHENADLLDKAVQQAKKWFQEKKAGQGSVTELPQGSSNLNSTIIEHVETGGGSPEDLAKSYMKTRSRCMSPERNIELKPPSTVSMKLFQEGTLYPAGHYSVSSSENRRSFASGSWNIQEELQRVRSRAEEDTVCSPSTKPDPLHFTAAQTKIGAAETFAVGEGLIEPQSLRQHKQDELLDAGISCLAALKSRQCSKASEALSSNPHTNVSVNKVPDCSACKLIPLSSPDHADGLHSDLQLGKVVKFVGGESAHGHGLLSSQVSLSRGVTEHNYQMENHMPCTPNVNINIVEGNCRLLSEACVEAPSMSETKNPASGCQTSSFGRKQQGRNASKYYRRSRVRGK
ncbi:protein KAKU4-like isoform X1 [Salvia divinorum]|uniref:Protein KAKU4-like isoform X1 n=1 Tax=Salvia divinorum TaxID=28513 RepID=A0ABD1FLG7_SALDI